MKCLLYEDGTEAVNLPSWTRNCKKIRMKKKLKTKTDTAHKKQSRW